jgi:hypothetical protein
MFGRSRKPAPPPAKPALTKPVSAPVKPTAAPVKPAFPFMRPRETPAPTPTPAPTLEKSRRYLTSATPAPQQPSGLRSIPMSLEQQQAQYDKNMAQMRALPPAEQDRALEQFQRAAAAGDKSTIRPGSVFGDGSGLTSFGGRRMKEGGAVKKMAKGGSVSSASKRADGCAIKGKTKGKVV